MKALLVQHGLERALEGEKKLPATPPPEEKKTVMSKAIKLSLFNKVLRENSMTIKAREPIEFGMSLGDRVDLFNQIMMNPTNMAIKVEDEDQTLLLMCSLPEAYESFVNTMLYGRTSIALEDGNAALNSEELQKKRNCPRQKGKQGKFSSNVVVAEESYEEGDILTITGNENVGVMILTASSMSGTLVGMKGLFQKGVYVLQEKASTTETECPTLEEKYLESLRDGGDLLETNKWEKHKLYVCGKASIFLTSNVAFNFPTLVKQIESTCQGHAAKLGKKVELGSKVSITQPGVEIIQGISLYLLNL
ncbi:hypothetical protein CRG98_013422 [Punica granatum]|uniref:Retrovirus-related Pol polyprotein from transposon TNT 1-94 n=1 Tax=Punica granatum TaxID=22663 RepID=A0A2I0KCA7_PUNGR|nr:hypothetical protein CRG98_013422 [Punica granatum]